MKEIRCPKCGWELSNLLPAHRSAMWVFVVMTIMGGMAYLVRLLVEHSPLG